MDWKTVEQLIRIGLYTAGGILFGSGIEDSAQYQTAIGGILAVASFVWWFWFERERKAEVRQLTEDERRARAAQSRAEAQVARMPG